MAYVWLSLAALLAGLVQGVIGFGAGIFLMLVLANLFLLPQAAALSGMIGLTLVTSMAYRYRQFINFRVVVWTCLFFMIGSSFAIFVSKEMNQTSLKIAFSLFLILLSLYFLWSKNDLHLKASLPVLIGVGAFSGVCDGFFSIGAPLMVLLYLAMTKSVEEYLGSLQLTFAIAGCYSLMLRLMSGIIVPKLLSYALVGIIAIQIGLQIGHRIVPLINRERLQQMAYVFIGLSGLVNLVTTLVTLS